MLLPTAAMVAVVPARRRHRSAQPLSSSSGRPWLRTTSGMAWREGMALVFADNGASSGRSSRPPPLSERAAVDFEQRAAAAARAVPRYEQEGMALVFADNGASSGMSSCKRSILTTHGCTVAASGYRTSAGGRCGRSPRNLAVNRPL